ncbi:MAG: peptidoglycan DD-metalloendopeptidase family protein [Geminicoccaceae bacterium]
MNPAGQRFFLVSATLGAFAVGTLTGAFATFGPDADTSMVVDVEPGAGLPEAALIEAQRVVISAEIKGQPNPPMPTASSGTGKDTVWGRQERGQFALANGQPDIAPDINVRTDLRASAQHPSFQVTDRPAVEPITPEDPKAESDSQIASLATIAKAALTPRPWKSQQVEVRRGDSLTTILKRAGIDGQQVHSALRSLKNVYDPRGLRAGQQLIVTAATRENQPAQLLSVALDLDFDHQLLITRGAAGDFSTKKIEQAKRHELVHRAGEIKESLYLSAKRVALPGSVTDHLIRLFSWDVDFQRDIRRGDRFETVYEEVTLEKDESQVKGELVYAGLTLRGKLIDAYLFSPDGGLRTYYDSEGRSLRKFLLRTPIDGARLSSGFGKRKHPVLGYTKMHKGTDFAAPRGTPIYAGGSGRIEKAERYGGYGNYIRIRHSDTWSTAYAHMHNFAKGIGPGVKVRQGQVIGYVGTTGRSTGNHLHYEVIKNDKQVNPMKMKQPSLARLEGAKLKAFEKERMRIDAMRERLQKEPYLTSSADANH